MREVTLLWLRTFLVGIHIAKCEGELPWLSNDRLVVVPVRQFGALGNPFLVSPGDGRRVDPRTTSVRHALGIPVDGRGFRVSDVYSLLPQKRQRPFLLTAVFFEGSRRTFRLRFTPCPTLLVVLYERLAILAEPGRGGQLNIACVLKPVLTLDELHYDLGAVTQLFSSNVNILTQDQDSAVIHEESFV